MRIALIVISEEGFQTALPLQRDLNADIIGRDEVKEKWHDYEAFIFVGAMGICVRSIAPLLAESVWTRWGCMRFR